MESLSKVRSLNRDIAFIFVADENQYLTFLSAIHGSAAYPVDQVIMPMNIIAALSINIGCLSRLNNQLFFIDHFGDLMQPYLDFVNILTKIADSNRLNLVFNTVENSTFIGTKVTQGFWRSLFSKSNSYAALGLR